jgi:hypothetical protein
MKALRPHSLLVSTLASGALVAGLTMLMTWAPSCETYVPPPTATIDGLTNGILQHPNTSIVLTFTTPIVPSTLSVVIAPFDIDAYSNLPDEVPDAGSLDAILSHTPTKDTHVVATLSNGNTTLTLEPTPIGWLPTGPSLVLLVDPGLTSATTGTVLHYRERIPFSYPATCGKGGPTRFHSGAYFFVLEVTQPVPVPLKDFAAIEVNPLTGEFFGQFTAALRNSDPTRCDPPCTNGNVCELVPTEKCVAMSEPPVNAEEYPDYVAKATVPNGYTFEMHGCATDVGDSGAVNILTQPGELVDTSPEVTAQGLVLTARFTPVDGGAVQATGSLTATHTYAFGGMSDLGEGAGTLTAISIPDAMVPANLPQPGAIVDGGADASAADATSSD